MRVALVLSLLVFVIAAGCGYKIHGRADLPFTEVAIGEIKNNTAEPKLQDRMHRLLAESLMEYGVDVRNSSRYRIEGEFIKFNVYPVAEKDLKAIEYQLDVSGNFRIIDTDSDRKDTKPDKETNVKTGDKKAKYRVENIGSVSNPYLTYFKSSDLLVSVVAAKEAATEKAIKELSQELVLRIIYKLPNEKKPVKKSGGKVEPETVPAGNR